MNPIKAPQLIVVILVIIGVWGAIYIFGPLDSVPRLRASAESPNGALSVKVYKKQLSFFPSPRVGILVNVHDNKNNLLYDKLIFEDGWWNEDVGEMYSKIYFVSDQIKIGPKFSPDEYFVIMKSDLKQQSAQQY